tara:strand:+ start:546 stop:710 length:165 start_codon:yes stop_codon:yes gene_type:complete
LFKKISGNIKINKKGKDEKSKRKLSKQGNFKNILKPVEPYTSRCLAKCLKFLSL